MSIASYFESGEIKKDKGHVKNLVLLANADGELSDEEFILIRRIGRHLGLTYTQIGEIIDNPNKYTVIPPVSKRDRFEHMIDMINLIQIDGIIDTNEMNLISKFAVQIGFKGIEEAYVSEILTDLNEDVHKDDIIDKLS